MKKFLGFFSVSLFSISLFASANLSIEGDAIYSIDNKISTSKVLKDGKTIKFEKGNGVINIFDNETNQDIVLDAPLTTYTAAAKAGIFSGLKAVFVKIQTSENQAATRGNGAFIELDKDKDVLQIGDSISEILIYRNDSRIASINLKNPTDLIELKSGDKIFLIDLEGYDSVSYIIK